MNALDYAIKMEKDGEDYYLKQAELNKNNSLHMVCMLLAKEENEHAELLTQLANYLPEKLEESNTYAEIKNIFSETENFKSDIKDLASQLDFYRFALENEQKSIDTYEDFLKKADNDNEKKVFEFLLVQEKEHFEIIGDIVNILENAEQWVESAELCERGLLKYSLLT